MNLINNNVSMLAYQLNKCTTLMQDKGKTSGGVVGSIWELLVLSAQYSCAFKTALKINSIL